MEQETRIPVWMALSELYLDTDLDTDVTTAYAAIARALVASPYTLDELRAILIDEVHPALNANLLQVAGEWAGFEQTWLIERIRSVRDMPLWRRRLSRLHFGLVREDWRAIEAMVRTARSAPAQS